MKFSTVLVAIMAGTAAAAAAAGKTVTKTKTKTTTKPAITKTVTAKTTSTVLSTVLSTAVTTSTSIETDTTTFSTVVTSTETDTVTVTSTTTPSPTFTSFIGNGNMIVFASGSKFGHVSKNGGWYTSSTPATYNGQSMADDNSMFTLTTSQGPCQVLMSGDFNCTAANTNTVFGQTADGNLTYMGSDVFGALSGPNTNAPGTVISDGAESFTLNIGWVSTS